MSFGNAGRHSAHANLRNQLHMNTGLGVGILQIVDELGQIFNGVDVVMRRRRDQPYAGRGVAGLGYPRPDFVPRQLPAFAGFCALRHFDLQVVGFCEILARHAEAPRCHLLDRAAAIVAVGVAHISARVFASFAGVGFAADAVHGDGKSLMGFSRDGAVRHRPGGEPLYYLAHRLHFVQRHRLAAFHAESEKPAQGSEPACLLVYRGGVFLEDVVAARAGGVLQTEDRLRIEEVILPFSAPLIFASFAQLSVRPLGAVLGKGDFMAARHFFGKMLVADAPQTAMGAGKALFNELCPQPDSFKNLRTHIRANSGDAHLGHDLQHALVASFHIVVLGFLKSHRKSGCRARFRAVAALPEAVAAFFQHLSYGVKGDIWIHRCRTVAQQQAYVMDFSGVARFCHQPHFRASLVGDQMVMHCAHSQQRRNRSERAGCPPVGKHYHIRPCCDCFIHALAKLLHGSAQCFAEGCVSAFPFVAAFTFYVSSLPPFPASSPASSSLNREQTRQHRS